MVGIQINKHVARPIIPPYVSSEDIEMEKKRKLKDDLDRELERVEVEASIAETRRKIQFLKASSTNTLGPSTIEIGMPSTTSNIVQLGNVTTHNSLFASSTKLNVNPKQQSTVQVGRNIDVNASPSGNTGLNFQRRPMQLEGYRKISFDGIPDYPNAFRANIRDKVTKFSGNNAISCEEHLRLFVDMLNDYEIEHDDVFMKLFVQSLVEDARD